MTSAEYQPTASVPSAVEAGEWTFQVSTQFHPRPALRERDLTAADYLARVEADPRRAAALARARVRAANAAAEAGGDCARTLVELRLAKGLSQAQLAAVMGTQQPNIARWERDPTHITADTMLRLAKALGVPAALILEAVQVAHG